ncbi:SlyX family protein [Schlegelella sp. S2-27]|uniref:SlyX family protein n=1 Tax=Caldimonas mangrovi TaxID=2944811 RepID=A0ABT0YUY2_9BURK|nr:SlyX family protein [Caldimonas mangrovi]MCM5682214.1 SlyX family protein [Caldimonas mangrovi]
MEDRIEQRLIDLEIKASYAEDMIDRLNEVVVRQQAQLETLARELTGLRQRTQDSTGAAPRSLREELPPHY